MKRRKLISKLLILASLLMPFVPNNVLVHASSAPSSAGSAWYVNSNWTNLSYAYSMGVNSTGGSGGAIVLDFGRQYYNGSTWGTYLPGSSYFVSDSTIQSISDSFINGYNDSHSTATYVYISTNNDNVGWGNGDSRWSTAGNDWGHVVYGITQPARVTVAAGNDFESWYGTGFIAYGSDSVNWSTAFSNYATSTLILNFGSDGNAEYPAAWSQNQVYLVSWGLSNNVAMPEIYYTSQVSQWKSIYQYNTSLYFYGTTSENGAAGSLTWLNAWNALNNAIPNDVRSAAIDIKW